MPRINDDTIGVGAVVLLITIFLIFGPKKFNSIFENGLLETFSEDIPISEDQGSSGLKFTPYMIPLSISIDSKEGIILSCEGAIPTPLGIFEIYKNISFPKKKTLTIVLAEKKHIYDLGEKSFKVHLPNDRKAESRVEYDGHGNIVVVIPNPIV